MKLKNVFVSVLFYIISAKSKVIVSPFGTTLQSGFNISNYVLNLGYPIEVHQNIQTEDGYLLEIHRIKHGRTNTNNDNTNPIVFLMHGLGTSCECWMIGHPQKALAFILADHGYDVWVGNARGTSSVARLKKNNVIETLETCHEL